MLHAGQPLGAPDVPATDQAKGMYFVWPTEEEVRQSVLGWASGSSLPGYQKKVGAQCLQPLLCRFHAEHCEHTRIMPHIKTYCRCDPFSTVLSPMCTMPLTLSLIHISEPTRPY